MRLPRLRLNQATWVKLIIFATIGVVILGIIFLQYAKVPGEYLGIGRYTVTLKLPESAGLYEGSLVGYRGVQVGKVKDVVLTRNGVDALLALKSGQVPIPSDLKAEVHSASAVGEQYVELVPQNGSSPPLRNGSVIPMRDTSVPPDINVVLNDLVTDLKSIPQDNLKTVIDEAYTAVGGLGPQIRDIVKGGTRLSIDARKNLDPLLALIDQVKPVLDSQSNTSDSIARWASSLATVTNELSTNDKTVANIIKKFPPALNEANQLFDRLTPTLPAIAGNVTGFGKGANPYHDDTEQILALLPSLMDTLFGAFVFPNADTGQGIRGGYLSFNLNINLPPPCLTGYIPFSQRRSDTFEDAPLRPGNVYCRTPQDSVFHVRGAKNYPCATKPGKRAPTVKLCESNKQYVALNDGLSWKGDPNATLTGLPVPDPDDQPTSTPWGGYPGGPPGGDPMPPGQSPLDWGLGRSKRGLRGSLPGVAGRQGGSLSAGLGSAPPTPAAEYNQSAGSYIGFDGNQYSESDLDQTVQKDKTWQTMMLPPEG